MFVSSHAMDFLTWQKLEDQWGDKRTPSPVLSPAELLALDVEQAHWLAAERCARVEVDAKYARARAEYRRLCDMWLGIAPGRMTPGAMTMMLAIAREINAAERAATERHYAALRRTVALVVVEPRDAA